MEGGTPRSTTAFQLGSHLTSSTAAFLPSACVFCSSRTSFSRKAQYEVVKPHIHALLFDVALPLLCFNDEDEQLWANDPHEYVRKGYGESA